MRQKVLTNCVGDGLPEFVIAGASAAAELRFGVDECAGKERRSRNRLFGSASSESSSFIVLAIPSADASGR